MPVKISVDKMASIIKAINELGGKDVLVGIPEGNTERKSGDPASNAVIGYIQEFGSPENNLPARPFLIPGVQDIQKPAAERLKIAAQRALSGDLSQAEKQLSAAGLMGQNSARAKINSNIAPALSPRTIAERHRQRGTKSMRKSEKGYLKAIANGDSPSDAQAAAGIVALINTGQLRNAITYVIRRKK